jgi:Mg2+ and Co2+ transporter CorA
MSSDINNDEENPPVPSSVITAEEAPLVRPLLQAPQPSYDSAQHPGLSLLTFSYLIEPDRGLRPATLHEALHRPDKQHHAWIDAVLFHDDDQESSSLQDLHKLIFKDLRVSPFLRRHLNQPNLLHAPQVLSLTNALLMVMRIIDLDSKKASDGHSAYYTAVLCLEEGLIVSATKTSSDISGSSRSDLSWRHQLHNSSRSLSIVDNTTVGSFRDRELIDHSISGCLVMYLSYHLEQTATVTQLLRERVMTMLELLDHDIASIQLREVVELKNTLMRLSAVAEEQNQCITHLADADASNDSFHFVNGSVNVLLSMAGGTERAVDRLEARMADIRSGYEAYQQERIKKRLNLLTIMSAVFLPLTLMAGIWGMST